MNIIISTSIYIWNFSQWTFKANSRKATWCSCTMASNLSYPCHAWKKVIKTKANMELRNSDWSHCSLLQILLFLSLVLPFKIFLCSSSLPFLSSLCSSLPPSYLLSFFPSICPSVYLFNQPTNITYFLALVFYILIIF